MPKTTDEYPHDPGSVDRPYQDLGASQGTIVKAAFRFWESKVLMSAVRLNVFEALASGPLDLAGLTRRVGVNPRGARDFFDALVALGHLLRREGDYMNAETTQQYLVHSRPNYLGGLLELADTRLFPVWDKLTDALKSGQPQNEAQQVPDYYSNLTQDQERLRIFLRAMTALSIESARRLAEIIEWAPFTRFADLGGGEGAFAVELAKRHEHLVGTCFELPEVEPLFDEYVARAGGRWQGPLLRRGLLPGRAAAGGGRCHGARVAQLGSGLEAGPSAEELRDAAIGRPGDRL